jgi:hypothetical protein
MVITPRDVHAFRRRLGRAFEELHAVRFADGPEELERRALLAAWHVHAATPVGWLEAPEAIEEGRDLEARLARLQHVPLDDGHGTTVGSKWLRFVTPGDVRDKQTEIDAAAKATNADVLASSLDDETKSAWGEWFAAWEKFKATEPGWLNAAAQMDHAEDLESQLHDWQVRLTSKGAKLSAPVIDKPDRPDLGDALSSTAKTVMVVAAVVAGVIAIRAISGK